MKNLLRWVLCAIFGKVKGVALTDAILDGPLGELIRNTDERLLADVLARIGKRGEA